jgi:uncharacterized membrane protein YdjX (TVP38/TMEM64 family)
MKYMRIAILLAVFGLTAYLMAIRDQAAELTRYGYPGVFLLNALASGTILMPAPGVMMTFAFGGVFEPVWVGIVAGAGAACGELSGYAAGYSGQGVALHFSLYERLIERMKLHWRATMLVLLVTAAIPNPFFDLVGIAAGVMRVRLDQFLAATLVGNVIKMVMFAYAGSFSVGWVSFMYERLLKLVP